MELAEILKLRNRGLSLFPVSNDTKVPLVKWARLQEERPTYAEIAEWFSTNNRSVGVAMGRTSGLLLLDLDFAKHEESRNWYESNRARLPRTWNERTKSGGLHLYFRWTPALELKQTNTTGLFASGVDTKGQGGYAKMAPSEGYAWVNPPHTTPLAVPPQWLIDALPAKGHFGSSSIRKLTPTAGPQSWFTDALATLKEGNREATFVKIAGSLRARGYSADDIFAILKGHANKLEGGESDLARICNSVGRYQPNPQSDSGQSADDVESFLEKIETVEWIVPNIVARKAIGFVAGLPETGKTWLTIDLAIEAARGGGSWLGRFATAPARVLYIDQERSKGETQRRFRAVLTAKKLDPKEIRETLFIKTGTTTRIDLQHSYDAFRKELADIRPDLVLVDSFVTFHTAEENNRGDIQMVLERIKQLRNEFGCTFIFIDHENKGAYQAQKDGEEPNAFRMAGSVAKPATAEFILTVRRHDPDTSMVYHSKSTQGPKVAPFNVRVIDAKDGIEVRAF